MGNFTVAKKFNITGVVQGVGFRPFIFQLANRYGLKGEVFNTSKGVTVIVETDLDSNSDISNDNLGNILDNDLDNSLNNDLDNLDNIEKFKADITDKKPPLAIIDNITDVSISPSYYKEFSISKSSDREETLSASLNGSILDERISNKMTLISPDVSVCDDCIREMQEPNDRRFGYPFINCTNCGPRYTIIKDTPYDRAETSMAVFKMCEKCRQEYDDPLDRRFHAQPNACPVCGPHLFVADKFSNIVVDDKHTNNLNYKIKSKSSDNLNSSIPSLEYAAQLLKQGKIVAVKGLGGFHLAVDAMNPDAVAELRKRKNRPHKPFALMARSVEAIEHLVDISLEERELLESYHRPIVLLKKKRGNLNDKKRFLSDLNNNSSNKNGTPLNKNSGYVDDIIKSEIAPDNPFLGVMLPYTPLHYLLLEKGPPILVMTSGNRSGEPLSIDNQDALDAFSDIADYFLLHNRDIYFRADDSIMQVQNKVPRFFRRSRGYAPIPITLPDLKESYLSSIKKYSGENLQYDKFESDGFNYNYSNIDVLGCGAGLKNTVCLTYNNMAFLSQHIGDLENEKVFDFYKQSIEHLKKIFNIEPVVIAYDLHPDYLSSVFASSLKEQKKQIYKELKEQIDKQQIETNPNSDKQFKDNRSIIFVPVQHHHAHAVSCMAENSITGDVIAIALDGTGLGVDGNIWGGEVLVCNELDFERKAHLKYIPMPGGDAAAREPWRMALSYLYAAFGEDIFNLEIPLFKDICGSAKGSKIDFIVQMIKKKINCPLTSSCGRLFDAVSSLCSIRHKITFESQAAIELQANCRRINSSERYDFDIKKDEEQNLFIIDLIPLIKEVVNDIKNSIPIESISSKFHQTVIESFACAAEKVSSEAGLKRVVLSGGVFSNIFILTGMTHALEKKGFTVYSHNKVPPNDGGISLGQAVIAKMKVIAEKT